MLAIGLYTVVAYPTNFAWWAFLLAIFISYAFSLPIGIIQAVTNTQIGLNVLTEFIYGYIQPGRPLGLMLYVALLQEVCNSLTYRLPQIQDIWLCHNVSTRCCRRNIQSQAKLFWQVSIPWLHCRSQIWPLHEGAAAHHVHGPSRRHHRVLFCPDCRPQPRPRQHRQRLRYSPARPIHLSWRPSLFLR